MNNSTYKHVITRSNILINKCGSAKQALFVLRKKRGKTVEDKWVIEHLGTLVVIENLRADNAEMAEQLGVTFDEDAK